MINKVYRPSQLPYLEGRYALDSNNCYRRHSHPTFSLGVVEQGRGRHYQEHRTQPIGPGAVVAINADVVHNCNPYANQNWGYHMLYIECDWLAALARDIGAAHGSHPSSAPMWQPVAYDADLYRDIVALNYQLSSGADALDTQTRLVDLLGRLLHNQNHRRGRPEPPASHPAIMRARDYLHDNTHRSVTLEELAGIAQLSPYHLIRRFKREIGLPPHAYQVNVRVNRAKQLLREKMSIAEVAAATGFSDQAHLQRNFKSHTAMTPAQYRNAH
ncbi:AraC family transcriptional regulator [Exilibacterium tricleocarpae]|nr:AraC family transcriptional regulator [Exilibacterium tricleocarpae]